MYQERKNYYSFEIKKILFVLKLSFYFELVKMIYFIWTKVQVWLLSVRSLFLSSGLGFESTLLLDISQFFWEEKGVLNKPNSFLKTLM